MRVLALAVAVAWIRPSNAASAPLFLSAYSTDTLRDGGAPHPQAQRLSPVAIASREELAPETRVRLMIAATSGSISTTASGSGDGVPTTKCGDVTSTLFMANAALADVERVLQSLWFTPKPPPPLHSFDTRCGDRAFEPTPRVDLWLETQSDPPRAITCADLPPPDGVHRHDASLGLQHHIKRITVLAEAASIVTPTGALRVRSGEDILLLGLTLRVPAEDAPCGLLLMSQQQRYRLRIRTASGSGGEVVLRPSIRNFLSAFVEDLKEPSPNGIQVEATSDYIRLALRSLVYKAPSGHISDVVRMELEPIGSDAEERMQVTSLAIIVTRASMSAQVSWKAAPIYTSQLIDMDEDISLPLSDLSVSVPSGDTIDELIVNVTVAASHGRFLSQEGNSSASQHRDVVTRREFDASAIQASGSLKKINRFLQQLLYTPNANYNGPDTIVVSVTQTNSNHDSSSTIEPSSEFLRVFLHPVEDMVDLTWTNAHSKATRMVLSSGERRSLPSVTIVDGEEVGDTIPFFTYQSFLRAEIEVSAHSRVDLHHDALEVTRVARDGLEIRQLTFEGKANELMALLARVKILASRRVWPRQDEDDFGSVVLKVARVSAVDDSTSMQVEARLTITLEDDQVLYLAHFQRQRLIFVQEDKAIDLGSVFAWEGAEMPSGDDDFGVTVVWIAASHGQVASNATRAAAVPQTNLTFQVRSFEDLKTVLSQLKYSPDRNYEGDDELVFSLGGQTTTLWVRVLPENDPPSVVLLSTENSSELFPLRVFVPPISVQDPDAFDILTLEVTVKGNYSLLLEDSTSVFAAGLQIEGLDATNWKPGTPIRTDKLRIRGSQSAINDVFAHAPSIEIVMPDDSTQIPASVRVCVSDEASLKSCVSQTVQLPPIDALFRFAPEVAPVEVSRPLPVSSFIGIEDDALLNETIVSMRLNAQLGSFDTAKVIGDALPCGRSMARRLDSGEPNRVYRELTGPWGCLRGLLARTTYHGASVDSANTTNDKVGIEVWYAARRLLSHSTTLKLLPPTPRYQLNLSSLDPENGTVLAAPVTWRWTRGRPALLHHFVEVNITSTATSNLPTDDDPVDTEDRLLVLNVSCSTSCLLNYDLDTRPAVPSVDYSVAPQQPSHALQFFGMRQSLTLLLRTLEIRAANALDATGDGYVEVHIAEDEDSIFAMAVDSARVEFHFETIEPPLEWRVTQQTYTSSLGSDVTWVDGVGLAADINPLQRVRVEIECENSASVFVTIHHPAVRLVDRPCSLSSDGESIEISDSLAVVNDLLRNVQVQRRNARSDSPVSEIVTIRFAAGSDTIDDDTTTTTVEIQIQFRPTALGSFETLTQRLVPASNTTLAVDEDAFRPLGDIFIVRDTDREDTQLHRMTATVSHGILEVPMNEVCCVNILSPSSTPRLVVESTLPALRDVLAAVLYKPHAEFSGIDSLQISIGAEEQHTTSWTYEMAIHVRPVNDAPRIAVHQGSMQVTSTTDARNDSITFYQTDVIIQLSDADVDDLWKSIDGTSESDPSIVRVRLVAVSETASIVLPRWQSVNYSLITVDYDPVRLPHNGIPDSVSLRSFTFDAPLKTANALLGSVLYITTTNGSQDTANARDEDRDDVDGELLEVYVSDLGHGLTTWEAAETIERVRIHSEAGGTTQQDALVLTLPLDHASLDATQRKLTISGLSIAGLDDDGVGGAINLDQRDDGSVVRVTGTAAFRVVPEVQRIRLVGPQQIQVLTVVIETSGGVDAASVTGTFQLQTTDPVINQLSSVTVYAQAVAMRVNELVGNEGTGRGRDESMEANVATLLATGSKAQLHVVKTVTKSSVTWKLYAAMAPAGSTLPPVQTAAGAFSGVVVGGAVTVSATSELFAASLGGTFTLRLGHEATQSINADATALQIQDALEELPSLHVVKVTSVGAYTFDVTFFRPGANLPLLEAETATLTPVATVLDAAWPTIMSIGADVQITRVTLGIGQGSVYEIDLDATHVSPVYRVSVSRAITTLSGGSFALSFRSDATGLVLATTEPIALDAVAMTSDESVLTQEGGRRGSSMESKLRTAITLLPHEHWSAATRLLVSRTSTGTPPSSYAWTITFLDAPSDFPTLFAAASTTQPLQARLTVVVSLLLPANTVAGSFELSFQGQTTRALPVSATAAMMEDQLNALGAVHNASTAWWRVVARRKEIRSVGGASFAVVFVEQMAPASHSVSVLVADGGALTGLGAFARVRPFGDSQWKNGAWVFPWFTSNQQELAPAAPWTRAGVQGLFEPNQFSLLGTAADVRVWLHQITYTIPPSWCCGFVSVVVRAQRVADATSDVAVVRTEERALAYQTPSRITVYTVDTPGPSQQDLAVLRGQQQHVGFLRIALPSSESGLLWLRARLRVSYGMVTMPSHTENASVTSELWLNGSAEAVNASLAHVRYTSPRSSEYEIDIFTIDLFAAANDQLLTRSEFLIRIDEPPFAPHVALANAINIDTASLLASDDTPFALRGMMSIVDANVAAGMAPASPLVSDIVVDLRVEAQLGELYLTRTDGLLTVSTNTRSNGAIVLRGSVAALNDALAGLTYSSSRVFSHTRDTVSVRVSYQSEDRPLLSDVRMLRIEIQHAIHVPRVTIASGNAVTFAAKEDNGYQFPNLTVSKSMSRPASQHERRIPVTELRRTELSPPLVTNLPIATQDDDPRHRWVADLPGLSRGTTSARSLAAFPTARFFVFAGTNRTHGEELWTSDGSANGTQLLADLMPGAGSGSPSDFAVLPPASTRVLFAADGIDRSWTLNTEKPCNRERASSTALDLLYVVAGSATWDPMASYDCPRIGWRWATTEEASARFKEHSSPSNLSEPYVFWGTCDWDGFVFGGVTRKYFRFADSAATGALKHAGRRDSAALEVSFSPSDFAGIVCVRDETMVTQSAAGRELWISDGSAAFGATKRLVDIDAGPRGSDPKFLTPFQSRWVVFQATTAVVGSELFKTDGTTAGTVLVEDIWRGPRSSRPSDFCEWTGGGDGRLYFAATTESGRELWSTDGLSSVTVERGRRATASTGGGSVLVGTALVRDICASAAGSSDPQFLTALGAAGVFFAATDCVNGRELWVTDGTVAGTNMVKDINAASGQGSDPSHLTAFNGNLYFAATASGSAMGRELFVSDGTSTGTLLLAELVPGVASAAPTLLTVANARLYFHATDAQGVGSVWVSDGTAAGTASVWDAPFAQSHVLQFPSTSVASTGLTDKFFVWNNALYYFTERRSTGARVGDDAVDHADVFQLQMSVNHGTISIPPDHPLASHSQVVEGPRDRLQDVLSRTLYHPPLNWNVLQSAGDHVVQWNFTVSSPTASLVPAETTNADLIVRPQLDPPVILVPTAVEHATASQRDYLSRLRLQCLPITVLEDVPTLLRGFSVRGVDGFDGPGMTSWELELSVSRGRLSVPLDAAGCVRTVTYGSLLNTKRVRLTAARVACLSRLLGTLTYTSDPHVSGADALTIRVRGSIGVVTATTTDAEDVAVVPIVVTEINDAPYLTPAPSGFFYDAEEDHALVINDLHVDDPDALPGQRLRVDMRVLVGAIVLLARDNSGISIEHSDAAAWSPGSSTRLVFSGPLSDVNAALATVAYTSAPHWNSWAHAHENDGYDVVSIVLSDSQAFNASTSAQLYVFVAPTPDAVVITAPVLRETSVYAGQARDNHEGVLHGDEDEWLETTGLAFTSEDDTARASLDVTLRVSHGRLALDETLLRTGGVSTAGSASDGSLWRLRGRFALVNHSVATLKYLPSQDFSGADALEIGAAAIDDYANQRSIATTRLVAITIHAVNDAPQWTLPTTRIAWQQDGSTRIAGVELRDVDAASADCDIVTCEWEVVVEVTGSGALTLPRLEQTPIDGSSASNYVVLSGSLAELNRALREIVLTTADLDNAVREPVDVWFTADDRGSFGSGGPQVARSRLVVRPLQWTRHALELLAPQDDVLMMDEDGVLIFNGSIALRDRDASTRATAVSPQYELAIESRHGRFQLAPWAFSAARLLLVPSSASEHVLRVRGFLPQLNAALHGSTYAPDADWFGTERIHITARQMAENAEDDGDDDARTVTVAVFVAPVCDAPRWSRQCTTERQTDLQTDVVLDEDGQALVTFLAIDDQDVLVADHEEEPEDGFHRELSVAIDVRDGGGVMLATTRGLRIADEVAPATFAAMRLLFFSHIVLTGRAMDLSAALHGLIYRPRPDFHTNGHVRDAMTLRVFAPSGTACASRSETESTTTVRAQIAAVNDPPRVVSSRFQQVTKRDIANDVIHQRFAPTQDASTDLPRPLDAISLDDVDVMDIVDDEDGGIPRPEANYRLRVSCRACSVTTTVSFETLQQTHGVLTSRDPTLAAATWGSSSTTYYAPIATLNAVVLDSLIFTSASHFAGHAVVLLEVSDLGFFGRSDGEGALETAFAMVVRVRRVNVGPQILVPPFGTRAPPLEVDEGASVLLQGAPPLSVAKRETGGDTEPPTWQLLLVDPHGAESPSRVRSLLDVTSSSVDPRTAVSSLASLSASQLVFSAFNASSGSELWTSDGTASGTQPLKDLSLSSSFSSSTEPRFLTRFSLDGRVYFAARGLDVDAWRLRSDLRDACDGARESTFAPGVVFVVSQQTVWDVDATYDCPPGFRWMLTAEAARAFIGTESHDHETEPLVYFGQCGWDAFAWGGQQRTHFRFADSRVTGAFKHAGHRDSYRADVGFQTLQFAGIVCRRVREDEDDEEEGSTALWATDGTREGTHRVTNTVARPAHVTEFNGKLMFQARTAAFGAELWATDGSRANTQLVADVAFGTRSSAPEQLTVANGKLFFSALTDTAGRELWVTDGASRGDFAQVDHATTATRLVLDIRAGAASSEPRFLTALPASGLLLFQADDGVHGAELWASDGSPSGTMLVLDIRSGARGSAPRFLTLFNGRVFFQADDGVHGAELWVTDGSTAGTQLLSDLVPGARGAAPRYLSVLQLASSPVDLLVFVAASDRDASVVEFWTSDGSRSGTQKLFAGSREVVTVHDEAMDDDARTTDAAKRLWPLHGGFVVIGRKPKTPRLSVGENDARVVVSRSLTLVDDDDDDDKDNETQDAGRPTRAYSVALQSERGGLLRLPHRRNCDSDAHVQEDVEAKQVVTLRGSLSTLNCLVAQVVYEAPTRSNQSESVVDGWDDAVVVTLFEETEDQAFSTTQRVRVRVAAQNHAPVVDMPARVFAPLDQWTPLPAIGVRDDDAGDPTARLLLRMTVQRGRVRLVGALADEDVGVTLLTPMDPRGGTTLEVVASLRQLHALLSDRRLVEYACVSVHGCDASSSDVVSVTVDDNGFSGRGGPRVTTQTAPVTVIA